VQGQGGVYGGGGLGGGSGVGGGLGSYGKYNPNPAPEGVLPDVGS